MKYGEDERVREQVGILVGLLASSHGSTRKLAIVQLSMLGRAAVPYLLSALRDNIPEYKKDLQFNNVSRSLLDGTAEALGMISDSSAIPVLEELVQNAGSVFVAEALAKIGNDAATRVLVRNVPRWYPPPLDYSHREYDEDPDPSFESGKTALARIFRHLSSEMAAELFLALMSHAGPASILSRIDAAFEAMGDHVNERILQGLVNAYSRTNVLGHKTSIRKVVERLGGEIPADLRPSQ